jgi:hypothetical protein
MKRLWLMVGLGSALRSTGFSGEIVLPYKAFGPQVQAYNLIGMEWWQWERHGSDQEEKYPIRVIVYWDTELVSIQKRYPVDRANRQDFRYVEYGRAVSHLEKMVQESKKLGIEDPVFGGTLKKLKEARGDD